MQDNAIQVGLEATQGSFLVGLIGISNTVARLVLGILSQKLNRWIDCTSDLSFIFPWTLETKPPMLKISQDSTVYFHIYKTQLLTELTSPNPIISEMCLGQGQGGQVCSTGWIKIKYLDKWRVSKN